MRESQLSSFVLALSWPAAAVARCLYRPSGRSMCEENFKRGGGSNAIPVYTASQIQGIREACKVRGFILTVPPGQIACSMVA